MRVSGQCVVLYVPELFVSELNVSKQCVVSQCVLSQYVPKNVSSWSVLSRTVCFCMVFS
jgi:hypothetical protein